ncbi:MAG: hypothetical protein ACI9TY_001019 [Alphaproteobacteria bacterium]|jgi:hypothetical protein
MNEEFWTEEQLLDDDTLNVAIVETTDAATGQSIFLAMTDDTSRFIGKGVDFEAAVTDLEIQMLEIDEFDDTPWELKLAS